MLNLKLTRLFPVHRVNVLQNTSVFSPQGQQGHTRDRLCCERGGAKVQVYGAVAMKGVRNQSWLCGETVRSVHEEFHLWKGKQGIGQHERPPVTQLSNRPSSNSQQSILVFFIFPRLRWLNMNETAS